MFSGIVRGSFPVHSAQKNPGGLYFSVLLNPTLAQDLSIGASIAVDGVCLTVVKIAGEEVFFEVIFETLQKTTLHSLQKGHLVNIERSLRMGEEIGGHLLSGHIMAQATIQTIQDNIRTLSIDHQLVKYILPKGYIALDGTSLTVVNVDPKGTFTVHLIPETLRVTSWGRKKEGDLVNVEIDSQTQAIVDTVERIKGIK